MDYIVNPWWIYLIGVSQSLLAFCTVTSILSGIGVIAAFILYILGNDKDAPDGLKAITGLALKIMFPIFILTILVTVFVPNKNTIIAMIVAQNVTYSRLDKITQNGKDIHMVLKQDVLDIIKEVKSEDTKTKETK
jgi:hypothetical protein